MKKIFQLLSIVLISGSVFAGNGNSGTKEKATGDFEGIIEVNKTTTTDTSNYRYYIKDNKLRLENIVHGEIKGVMLIDVEKKTVIALSPERKLYMDVNNSALDPGDKNAYEVIKTGNKKTIHGYECEQIRVKNKAKNTEVTYWVASGEFSFFNGFLTSVNRKENSSIYWLVIDGTENAFPFLSVERSTLREEKSRMEVTKVTKKSLESTLFDIPSGYVKFEK